jgi:SAM-dependent methyltransferase
MRRYRESFYRAVAASAAGSASVIVPIVVEALSPRSVVDVGCGRGTWLADFARHGVSDYIGVDGFDVDTKLLEIAADRLVRADLGQPLELGREFDLAVCLEVAEHLPAGAGPILVDSLVRHAPLVLFSAAIPGQGGTSHVNERWPSYWAGLFASRGFACVDLLRAQVWTRTEVDFWYAQNTLLYVKRELLVELADHVRNRAVEIPQDVVHPALYEKRALNWTPRAILVNGVRAIQGRRARATARRDTSDL